MAQQLYMKIDLSCCDVFHCFFLNFYIELESGMMMYDVLSGNEIFVQCPILCVACDNPRASEICHHLGSTARHFCRDCDVC